MEVVREADQEFRFQTWGPKYLRKGPEDWEGGIIVVAPGKRLETHYHEQVEEFFYVIQGTPTVVVDEHQVQLQPREAIRIGAKELHTIVNDTNTDVKVFFVKSPYLPKDRVTLEEAR